MMNQLKVVKTWNWKLSVNEVIGDNCNSAEIMKLSLGKSAECGRKVQYTGRQEKKKRHVSDSMKSVSTVTVQETSQILLLLSVLLAGLSSAQGKTKSSHGE